MQLNPRNKFLGRLEVIPSITWILLGLLVVFIIIAPYFGTLDNAINIIRQGAVLAIVATGMMVAITSGGIDLAVGSFIGLAGTVTGYAIRQGLTWPVATLLGISICGIAGLISGLIIAKGRIFPFVVTFGMLFMARSLSLGVSQGGSIHIGNETFSLINGGAFLFLPTPFWITLALILTVLFLLKRTVFGRYIFSIGSDATGAASMGINVDLYRVLVYILSGTLAGIAGVVLASRVNTGNALIGQGTEFFAIAAVVIGGTPITGGRGSLAGAILGALVISVLQNGLSMLGLPSEKITAIVGVTLMVGVILAQSTYRGGSRGNK
jgi:ribose/xylose/arabinose/galactoside ABC-type transport system permease subunit